MEVFLYFHTEIQISNISIPINVKVQNKVVVMTKYKFERYQFNIFFEKKKKRFDQKYFYNNTTHLCCAYCVH